MLNFAKHVNGNAVEKHLTIFLNTLPINANFPMALLCAKLHSKIQKRETFSLAVADELSKRKIAHLHKRQAKQPEAK